MTAPTTGEREPSIITLMRQDLLRGEDMPASDLRVLAYVDALRAEIARVTAERDEDRRDYAADTAMAVACIEALREVRPEWESLFYATEESKMEDCAAFTIRQLADQLATAQREEAGLREKAKAAWMEHMFSSDQTPTSQIGIDLMREHPHLVAHLDLDELQKELDEWVRDFTDSYEVWSKDYDAKLTPAPEAGR